ncbi:DUF1223 domain-containing protein [Arcobacter sp. LA11]|uniref:DUF1223 domain-containing protein n=1 Tax=Arcobacter sp. LA11 TaxID=1898176 RepID=UPI0009354CBB|nr:DUF1223 domain-containing protein [Arcobacter sp. LA11]
MKKLLLITAFLSTILFAQDHTFESKDDRVNIIELYTSQGCSSCPPADKWLSNLKEHPKLFKDFIPMAFHITYWDFIGWKDVFATKSNDNRQRYYSSKVWKKNSVYTPQFIINAKEYRTWFTNQSFPNFKNQYGGKLNINLNNNKLQVSYFNKNIKNQKIYLNVGILGFDYEINIKRGENKYKTLEHDFVVLNHIQKFAEIKNNKLEIDTTLFNLEKNNKKKALVIWLSDYNSEILQATGGYI